jgi:hypothetical protein
LSLIALLALAVVVAVLIRPAPQPDQTPLEAAAYNECVIEKGGHASACDEYLRALKLSPTCENVHGAGRELCLKNGISEARRRADEECNRIHGAAACLGQVRVENRVTSLNDGGGAQLNAHWAVTKAREPGNVRAPRHLYIHFTSIVRNRSSSKNSLGNVMPRAVDGRDHPTRSRTSTVPKHRIIHM